MRLLTLAALALLALAPAALVEPAEACRPVSWYCPLNGQYYHGCAGGPPSAGPLVQCAKDTEIPR